MRFLVDECTGPVVARWLRDQQHEVFSVYEQARGLDDDQIIQKAFAENWVLITNDKDFGEKIYRERYPHRGVVLMRLSNDRAGNKVDAIRRLLQGYASQLVDRSDLTTALFNKDILLAKSLFIVVLCACPSSGLCRGVGRLSTHIH